MSSAANGVMDDVGVFGQNLGRVPIKRGVYREDPLSDIRQVGRLQLVTIEGGGKSEMTDENITPNPREVAMGIKN